jgi:hypothetical protein
VIERIDELVIEFPKLIPDEWCDLIVEWFDINIHLQQPGRIVNNNDDKTVFEEFKLATQSIVPFETPMFELMTKIWHMSYDSYLNIVERAPIEDVYFRDYSVRVYEKNIGFFKPHVDQHAGGTVTRLFAIILYLNDVKEGGETEFGNLNIKVKPEKGKVLMFPCNFLYPHHANVPISDPKYIATAFINFKNIDDLQQS